MKTFVILINLLLSIPMIAQSQKTISSTNTVKTEPVSIHEFSWIEGHWKGEAFGGIAEEIWSAPNAGSMMFVFRHIADDKVTFYESGAIMETAEGLILKLKHFHNTMKGWEEKDKTIDFKFMKLEDNKIVFDGLTFEKLSANEMNVYVRMREKDGSESEIKFNYKKQ